MSKMYYVPNKEESSFKNKIIKENFSKRGRLFIVIFVVVIILAFFVAASNIFKHSPSSITTNAFYSEPEKVINDSTALEKDSFEKFNQQLIDFSENLSILSVNQNQAIIELVNDLKFCAEENKNIEIDLVTSSDSLSKCIDELENIQMDNNVEIAEKVEELETLEESYILTISLAAYNICCKQRIDNPSIDSYTLIDNRIVCNNGGTNKLSC